nr:hypothetical protein CFP56_21104 [Quercus suber]
MAARRSLKSLLSRRRREEDDEDDEGPVLVGDSQSEGSVLDDGEDDVDDDDADGSSLGGRSAAEFGGEAVVSAPNKPESGPGEGAKGRKAKRKARQGKKGKEQGPGDGAGFKTMADTEAMMSGLRIDASSTAVDFESMEQSGSVDHASTTATPTAPVLHDEAAPDTTATRQLRDAEDDRKKRDGDSTFVPNRGNFFMHDTRRGPNGQPAYPGRGAWAGRGRGRGAIQSGGSPAVAPNASREDQAGEQLWRHDLHDTINEEPAQGARMTDTTTQQETESAQLFPKASAGRHAQGQPRVLSFSSSTLVGKVQIRVFLPGMQQAINFSEVPWKHYIRLPNHRPPLRRDKPVRVALPNLVQRYIFPSPDRSFIFIPRQMRPNQQGYGRNNYQRGLGGGVGYASRRTSMYGGSMYSASVAASRRSSMAGISRADAFSPNSFASGMHQQNRPVVRLPHGPSGQSFPEVTTPSRRMSGQQTQMMGMPQVHTYPLPQQPAFQGTPTTMVHQPRPQKAISVTGIESPAALQQAPPAHESQPFQNQLPAHMNDPMAHGSQPAPYYSPRQQFQQPQQPHVATPLSGIPEQAMHAQPFQPQSGQYGQPYYPQYPPHQSYYYPSQQPGGYAPMPMYMPPPQNYMMPPSIHQPPPLPHAPAPHMQPPSSSQPPPQARGDDEPSQPQSGMVAHESNGMVFYLPASEAQQQPQAENYQPAESFVPSFAMPGLPPTPAPESTYYYPSVPPPMQMQGAFYPTQG